MLRRTIPNVKHKTFITITAAVLIILLLLGIFFFINKSTQTLNKDPIGNLPATSIGYLAVNTEPSLSQQLQIGKLLSTATATTPSGTDTPKITILKTLTSNIFSPNANYEELANWTGPIITSAIIDPTRPALQPVQTAAFTTTNNDEAQAWLKETQRNLSGQLIWNTYQTENSTNIVVAAHTDPTLLEGPTLNDTNAGQALNNLNPQAVAATWLNLEATTTLSTKYQLTSPVLNSLTTFGVLGLGTTGTLTANLTAENSKWVVKGVTKNLKLSGVSLATQGSNLSAIANAPLTTQVGVASGNIDKQLTDEASNSGSQAKNLATSMGLKWPEATTSAFGTSTVIAVGPKAEEQPQWGWRAYNAGPEAGPTLETIASDFLVQRTNQETWTVTPTVNGAAIGSTSAWSTQLANPKENLTLGSSDTYKELMPSLDDVSLAVYLDAKSLKAGSDSTWWTTIEAIGGAISEIDKNGNSTFTLIAKPA